MLLILFGESLKFTIQDFIYSLKEFFQNIWDSIYSFLAQYFTDAMIYLFVGAILLAVILVLILKIINHK